MTMKWRLSKLPTPDEIRELVKDKIITQEEARQILFDHVEAGNEQALKDEIKFLRTLVDKLSQNRTQIIETIKEVEKPYYRFDWYQPYHTYCNDNVVHGSGGGLIPYSDGNSTGIAVGYDVNGFTDISTY